MAKKKRFKKGSPEARAYMAKIRAMRSSNSPLIIGGPKMSKRKGSKGKSVRRYSGKAGNFVKKVTKRFDLMTAAKEIGGVGVGIAGGSLVANFVPIKDSRIKALVPMIIGLILPMFPDPFIRHIGHGSLAVGAISLMRQLLPQIPILAGGENLNTAIGTIRQLPQREQAVLAGIIEPGASMYSGRNNGQPERSVARSAVGVGPENYT